MSMRGVGVGFQLEVAVSKRNHDQIPPSIKKNGRLVWCEQVSGRVTLKFVCQLKIDVATIN